MDRTAKDPQLDKVISGPVLSIQAKKLHKNLHIDNLSDFVT